MGIIAKQSIRGTIANYIGIAVGFVTTFFVLTRFLTAEEIGLARVIIDAATLFIGLAQLGTNSSIIRFFPYFQDGGRNHGFFFWTIVIPLFGLLLFTAVYCAFSSPLSAWFGDKSPLFVQYYYYVLPIAFFMLYQSVFEVNANTLMHIVVPRIVREVVVRVGLLVIYLLYAMHVLSMDGFVIALCLNYALAAIINFCYLLSLGHISFKPDYVYLRQNPSIVREFLLYTGFLIVSAITSVLAPTLSSFFITAQMGLNYTGIFAIATYIAVMVSIPYRSVVSIAQPELSKTIKDNDTANTMRLISQTSTNLLLIGGFILLAIWINIDLIFNILPNGSTYAAAKNTILLLGLGQLLVSALNIFVPALSYSRFYAFSLLNSLVLTLSAIFLNNILIPRYGMDGAALATLCSDVIYYILVVGIACMALKISIPFSSKHLRAIGLILLLFILNALWQHFLSIENMWLDSIGRSLLFLPLFAYIAYKLDISPEINALLHSVRL